MPERQAVSRASMRRIAVALLAIVLLCPGPSSPSADRAGPVDDSPIAAGQRRGVEQTLLTYPEWFLVHSPAEYARYVAVHPAHGFPFLGHIGQLWDGYAAVVREQLRAGYPFNAAYHAMILVIASSTTLEYALRSAYENTAGRLSWALSSGQLTAEDRYGARVAQDYVDFIRRQPWYLFDFGARLHDLWRTTPAFGPDLVREWERRYALTTEYAIKAVYGKLIERATRAAYDPALLTTQVVVDRMPDRWPVGVRPIRTLADGRVVLELPRYFDFRIAATALASDQVHLVDIAGNRSVILVTLWSRDALALPVGARVLFEQPMLTMPGTTRLAVLLPVDALSTFLAEAPSHAATIEHVYDY